MDKFQKIGAVTSLVLVSNFSVAGVYELVDLSSGTESGSFTTGIEFYGNVSEIVFRDGLEVRDRFIRDPFNFTGTFDFNDTFNFTVPDKKIAVFYQLGLSTTHKLDERNRDLIGDIVFSEAAIKDSVGTVVPWSIYYYQTGPYTSATSFGIGSRIYLASGDYSLVVNGSYNDIQGYRLSSYWALESVSLVPEPSSIGLMLGGLGLVSFMVARRRKKA